MHYRSVFGFFDLTPLHHHRRSPLRAWSAADALLLREAHELRPVPERLLVVNDVHGALGVCLQHWRPFHWNDSYTSLRALQLNLRRNGMLFLPEHWVTAAENPEGLFDTVLLRIPKSLSLLRDQLTRLRPCLSPQTRIIASGMVKHLSRSTVEVFEQCIGPSHRSLAERKARLVFAELDPELAVPAVAPTRVPVPNTDLELISYAGVFSQQKSDPGTLLLLTHFPDVSGARHILDLGCGNGVLACHAGRLNPAAQLTLLDNSWLALRSARETLAHNDTQNPAEFIAGDALDEYRDQVDLVLCNPPFHAGNRLDGDIARRMFQGAARCLTPEGSLVVVGNRHLGYHRTLQTWFDSVELVASNPKFVVLRAAAPRPGKASRK
ncbi:MAG: class I SAM-dependent methyltransferase [Pseudomonadota bacterium]|nr:50S rRNA methyltransferase [Pseudomonadales bacterium]MDY6919342.1 class I SAM-dependent methyltransferase [Pseudomonadota bacterium]